MLAVLNTPTLRGIMNQKHVGASSVNINTTTQNFPNTLVPKEEQWLLLIGSINKAARLLNLDLREQDMPDYMNWLVARNINQSLWGKVCSQRNVNE